MEEAKKIITKISADPSLRNKRESKPILRVAAYCRVSTDSEDQLESYKAQVEYYTESINKNPKWRLVDIYADEGISGTRTTKRINFNRMIKDCEKGKIDMILTKSVARFARNTVDSLKYIRKLKAMGIGVFFEEQNLDSLKADSEMFIGLHSVIAQSESENISANVRWGIQQRMKTGTYKFHCNLLGYYKGDDGLPHIKEDEAEIVRNIYKMYLDGGSLDSIKKYLEDEGIKTIRGKKEWSKNNIKSILTNEKYCGDMLLQKTFVDNCITKKVKKNNGEMDKYLISNDHPAIVSRDLFNDVQIEMNRRSSTIKKSTGSIFEKGKYSSKYLLSNLLFCGECGSPYRRKTYIIGGKKKYVWRCLNRLENGKRYCHKSVTLDEELLHNAITRALSKLLNNTEDIMNEIKKNFSFYYTGANELQEINHLEKQIQEYKDQLDILTIRMIKTTGDKKRFENEIKDIVTKITELEKLVKVKRQVIIENGVADEAMKKVNEILNYSSLKISEYNEYFIRLLVSRILVTSHNSIIVFIKSGTMSIEENL